MFYGVLLSWINPGTAKVKAMVAKFNRAAEFGRSRFSFLSFWSVGVGRMKAAKKMYVWF